MDGVLLLHARTGHILYGKAYTEGYGIRRDELQSQSRQRLSWRMTIQ